MKLVDKYRIDISKLNISLHWNKLELKKLYSKEGINIDYFSSLQSDRTTKVRIIGIFSLFFLFVYILIFFPLDVIHRGLNEELNGFQVFISPIMLSVYLYWLRNRIRNRYVNHKRSISCLLSVSDFIPLAIYIAITAVTAAKLDETTSEIIRNPLNYILSSTIAGYDEVIGNFVAGFAYFFIVCMFAIFSYYVWIDHPDKYRETSESLINNKLIIVPYNNGKKNFLDRLPYNPFTKEFSYNIQSISPEEKSIDIWRFCYPNYIYSITAITIVCAFLFGLSLMYFSKPYEFIISDLISKGIGIAILCFCIHLISIYVYKPIRYYFKLRKTIINEIEGFISKLLVDDTDNPTHSLNELLYLKECLDTNRKYSKQSLLYIPSWFALLIPIIYQFLSSILSNIS